MAGLMIGSRGTNDIIQGWLRLQDDEQEIVDARMDRTSSISSFLMYFSSSHLPLPHSLDERTRLRSPPHQSLP